MGKLYRFKKEVKQYFNQDFAEAKLPLEEFISKGFSEDALEEVIVKYEVLFDNDDKDLTLWKAKGSEEDLEWTENERALFEFVLNEFGDIEGMETLIEEYSKWYMIMCGQVGLTMSFKSWFYNHKDN